MQWKSKKEKCERGTKTGWASPYGMTRITKDQIMYMPKNPLPFSVRGILYHLDGGPHLLSVLDAEVLLLEDALEKVVFLRADDDVDSAVAVSAAVLEGLDGVLR